MLVQTSRVWHTHKPRSLFLHCLSTEQLWKRFLLITTTELKAWLHAFAKYKSFAKYLLTEKQCSEVWEKHSCLGIQGKPGPADSKTIRLVHRSIPSYPGRNQCKSSHWRETPASFTFMVCFPGATVVMRPYSHSESTIHIMPTQNCFFQHGLRKL